MRPGNPRIILLRASLMVITEKHKVRHSHWQRYFLKISTKLGMTWSLLGGSWPWCGLYTCWVKVANDEGHFSVVLLSSSSSDDGCQLGWALSIQLTSFIFTPIAQLGFTPKRLRCIIDAARTIHWIVLGCSSRVTSRFHRLWRRFRLIRQR